MSKILYFITDMDPMGIELALGLKNKEVGICLLQDAVYFGCKGRKENGRLVEALKRNISIFAAKKDIELRGLTKLFNREIKILDYGEIIDLILQYDRIVNV
ncbi:MAG: DsrH/TusB family sulfur metabolism protein [Candidatus Bathyarchaeia archaeon]